MGRKLIPDGLRRKTIGISFPLDIIAHLDKKAHKSGMNRSRYLEALIRGAMLKGQATLKQIISSWECSKCGTCFETLQPGLESVICHGCKRQLDPRIDFKGQRVLDKKEEELN
jgi:hypothetical protein